MFSTLKLPFVYASAQRAQLIEMQDDGRLTVKYYNDEDKTMHTQDMVTNCTRFCSAADQQGKLHVLAADSQHRLTYCVLENSHIKKTPFVISYAPEQFMLAFSSTGVGYFIGQGEEKITIAVGDTNGKWELSEKRIGTNPAPVGLVADQAGYAHYLLYDLADDILWFSSVEPRNFRSSSPLQLANRVKMETEPAFLLDSVQNIHVAWVSTVDGQLHYRVRLAGGWPVGGWQQEFSIPLDFSPRLLTFNETYPHPVICIVDSENVIHYFNSTDTEEKKQNSFEENRVPLRVGRTAATDIRLVTLEPGSSLLAEMTKETKETQVATNASAAEEEENPFFLHARRLMNEKKRLEFELSKREASLAQLKHMLELSQENVKKQTVLLNEKLSGINSRVRELQQKNSVLEAKCQDLQEYSERYRRTQNLLEQSEAGANELRQQLSRVRNELAASLLREKEYLQKIKRLEEELAAKKGMWESITTMFHKKPSPKK